MPRKRKSKCAFIDCEAAEEDEEGNIIKHDSEAEDDEDAYESDFVDDSEEVVVRRPKVRIEADEYEVDEDDWLLLEDNARANRVSRITRAECSDSSDSDSFIDDDGVFENVAVDPLDELYDAEVLDILVSLAKESENVAPPVAPPSPPPVEPPPPMPLKPIPSSMYMPLADDVIRRKGPSWADFNFKQAPAKKPRAKGAAVQKTKLEPGVVRTAEGMFLVTGAGKRIRLTEDGSVKH
jgi:hypothetical protein